MDWSTSYPAFAIPIDQHVTPLEDVSSRPLVKDVTVADIGCGFGGLLVALAPKLPDELLLGRTFDISIS